MIYECALTALRVRTHKPASAHSRGHDCALAKHDAGRQLIHNPRQKHKPHLIYIYAREVHDQSYKSLNRIPGHVSNGRNINMLHIQAVVRASTHAYFGKQI